MAKPSKTPQIEAFVNTNTNSIFTTKEMCDRSGVSLPTLLSYIRSNSQRFELVSYGSYRIVHPSNSAAN